MQPGKIHILVPHSDAKDWREWKQYFDYIMKKPNGTVQNEIRGYGVNLARELLADIFMQGDAEWSFWLDDDLIGPQNILEALLSMNKPIACGLYMAKKKLGERGLAAWMKVSDNKQVQNSPWGIGDSKPGYAAIGRQQNGRFIQVDVTGMGCALIHRNVFEKTPKPWFEWKYGNISEDFYFFEKVWQYMQIKPVIDFECKFWHLGEFKVNIDGEFTTLDM